MKRKLLFYIYLFLTIVILLKEKTRKLNLIDSYIIEYNIKNNYQINVIDKKDYILKYDFFVRDNKKLSLKIFGEIIEENVYFINKIEILEKEKVIQTINIENLSLLDTKYIESNSIDGDLEFLDLNFDGSLDIGIKLYNENRSNDIYYYLLWDNNKNCYKDSFTNYKLVPFSNNYIKYLESSYYYTDYASLSKYILDENNNLKEIEINQYIYINKGELDIWYIETKIKSYKTLLDKKIFSIEQLNDYVEDIEYIYNEGSIKDIKLKLYKEKINNEFIIKKIEIFKEDLLIDTINLKDNLVYKKIVLKDLEKNEFITYITNEENYKFIWKNEYISIYLDI